MQQFNPSEISEIIRERIGRLDVAFQVRNEGITVNASDDIMCTHGLADVAYGEMTEFPDGVYGTVLNLERDFVGAVVLGGHQDLVEGMNVRYTGRILEVPVGSELLGRVVGVLGNPIDGKGPIDAEATDVIEKVASGVIRRKSVDQLV